MNSKNAGHPPAFFESVNKTNGNKYKLILGLRARGFS